jgi:hypothetical protein
MYHFFSQKEILAATTSLYPRHKISNDLNWPQSKTSFHHQIISSPCQIILIEQLKERQDKTSFVAVSLPEKHKTQN